MGFAGDVGRTLNSALSFHRLLCRGGNENLQTGVTDTATQVVPTPSRTLTALRVRQVAAGGMHSLALTEGGDVWGWGQPLMTWGTSAVTNVYDKQRAPSRVEGAVNCVRIAAGAFHNLALTATGHVLSWGNSDYGQLGLGSTTHVSAPHVVRSHRGGPYVHDVVMIDAQRVSLFSGPSRLRSCPKQA
jgi:alpha-tubulin suppressor-like RCC1 family protein